MDYEKLIHTIIDPIISHPDAVLIREIPDSEGKEVRIVIAAESEDTSRLIGRKGVIANSIREVVSIAGKTEERHVHLTFESFKKEEDI